MAPPTLEKLEDLARIVLAEAHHDALAHRTGGSTSAHDLWATARRRRTRRHGVAALALAAAVVGVSGPLWWPDQPPPGPDQAALTTQPSARVSPAEPPTSPEDQQIPTTLPDGQPYDHDQAMAADRASDIIDLVLQEDGYAGLEVDPESLAITLHWSGSPPASLVAQARDLAAPSELIVDSAARFSREDLIAVMNTVSDQTQEDLMTVGMIPDYQSGQITVQALPESPLHTTDDPAALLGLAGEGVEVVVVVVQPEDIPTQ